MGLHYLAGRAWDVRARVNTLVGDALGQGMPVILLVPAQFTLQAERDTLGGLNLPGSFLLEVLSPAKLYARIFDMTGWPSEARVDEQGRVMLLHAAAERLKGQFVWYKSAVTRPGFAERALSQLSAFKQAGLSPEDIRQKAQVAGAGLKDKLHDLALLYAAYEESLKGRFMDGEDEQARAILGMPMAEFLKDAHVCVHGFDLVTPALAGIILPLCDVARGVTLAMTLETDRRAGDHYLYEPVRRSLRLLHDRVCERGIAFTHERAPQAAPAGTSRVIPALERALFSVPAQAYPQAVREPVLLMAKNPDDEAELIAATARHLARTRGYRYRDMGLVCHSADQRSMDALARAFSLADVPLFLASGRSADRHPLALCLLGALRIASRGLDTGDVVAYIRSGCSGLTDDEADRLVNYALTYGLRGNRWKQPLSFGPEEVIADCEPLRQKLMESLEQFIRQLRKAPSTRARLTAIYDLLESLGAYDALEQTRQTLEKEGLSGWAMEGVQVWNRIIDALDQIDTLLGDQRLSTASIYELLRRALHEAVIKALPQSADAVEGGALDHLKGKPVKVLFICGVSDAAADVSDALISEAELHTLSSRLVALSDEERARMRRLRLKALLSMTGDFLMVSRPLSDAQGRALQAGALMDELERIVPGVRPLGGVSYSARLQRLRLEQPGVALARLGGPLRKKRETRVARMALESMDVHRAALARLDAAARHAVRSERVPADLRGALCSPRSMSATQLEEYAACPFRHFVNYTLKPEPFEAFELSPRDAGSFYHEALEAYVRTHGDKLGDLSTEDSCTLMDKISADIIDHIQSTSAHDTALAAHELHTYSRVARRAAAIVTSQLSGSQFRPVAVEANLLSGEVRLQLDAHSVLGGRIDRLDAWQDGESEYLRVIDYKRNGRSLSLDEIYYGLTMQLMIYLAGAMHARGGKPAGVFHFNVSDPLIASDSLDADEVDEARKKELRLSGLIVRDARVISAMAGEPSKAMNVDYKADGDLKKSDSLVTEGQFGALIDHTLALARRQLSSIRAGDTSISPAKSKKTDACKYCKLGVVCQFDEALPGASARVLPAMKAEEVFEAIMPGGED